jgi:hypothetical protein
MIRFGQGQGWIQEAGEFRVKSESPQYEIFPSISLNKQIAIELGDGEVFLF